MKKDFILLFFLYHLSYLILGQTSVLKLDEVIEIALTNNFDIKVANEELIKAKNLNTIGNAGMLPTLGINSSINFANNATKQNFATGLVVDKKNVKSNNINSSIFFTWTIFDGLRMFHTKERLNQEEINQSLELRSQIETILYQLINNYYSTLRQQQVVYVFEENLKLTDLILKITSTKENVGLNGTPDLIRAKLNQNESTSALIREKIKLKELKLNLSILMNDFTRVDFILDENVLQDTTNNIKQNLTIENNTNILKAKNAEELSKSILKQTRSIFYPRINLNSSYIFSRNENAAGFSLLNQNLGLNNGLSISWNIFNGGVNKNLSKNAQLDLLIAKLRQEQIARKINVELEFYSVALQEKLEQIDLANKNKTLADQLLKIELEKYKQGLCNSIDINFTRQEVLNVNLKQIEELYNYKQLELEMKLRIGKLIR